MTRRFPAVVVGMGPAGLAAAIELGRAGVSTQTGSFSATVWVFSGRAAGRAGWLASISTRLLTRHHTSRARMTEISFHAKLSRMRLRKVMAGAPPNPSVRTADGPDS